MSIIIPNTSNELVKVQPDEISHVEADGNYCQMQLINGEKQDLWFNLAHFSDVIDEQLSMERPTFISVGRSLIVNCRYIYRINPVKQEIVLWGHEMKEKAVLHASKKALQLLKDYMAKEYKEDGEY